MEVKKCLYCKKEKTLACYSKDKSKKDGKSSVCKECFRVKKQPTYYKVNKKNKLKISEAEQEFWKFKDLMETNTAIL